MRFVALCFLLIGLCSAGERENRRLRRVLLREHNKYRKRHRSEKLNWSVDLAVSSAEFCNYLAENVILVSSGNDGGKRQPKLKRPSLRFCETSHGHNSTS